MATKQETFDTVVAHLRKQGAKSLSAGGLRCAYRGVDGRKCAAGCLIPNDKYDPFFEGAAVCCDDGNFSTMAGCAIQAAGHDLILTRRLQKTHDGLPVVGWEIDFKVIAHEFSLTYTPPAPCTT